MKTAFYRMPDGDLIGVKVSNRESMETLSLRPPKLLLVVDGTPNDTPKRCELCVHKDSCWQYEARRENQRVCDIYEPWE
mgnify:CR=1 FL=1